MVRRRNTASLLLFRTQVTGSGVAAVHRPFDHARPGLRGQSARGVPVVVVVPDFGVRGTTTTGRRPVRVRFSVRRVRGRVVRANGRQSRRPSGGRPTDGRQRLAGRRRRKTVAAERE